VKAVTSSRRIAVVVFICGVGAGVCLTGFVEKGCLGWHGLSKGGGDG